MNKPSKNIPDDSIKVAILHLRRVKLFSLIFTAMPIILIISLLIGWRVFLPERANDLFVIIILSLFAVGQLVAFFQLLAILKGSMASIKVLQVLVDKGENPELEELQEVIRSKTPPCYLKDLLLKWIYLSIKGEVSGNHKILQNTTQRRTFLDDKKLNFHIVLNRTTLKLGFLGTLIGLLATFTPMQEAIKSLNQEGGDILFVDDIVRAIQGDKFAIFSTMIATGLSMLIELFTIQVLMRLFAGFELSDSHINDWNVMVLQKLGKQRQYQELPQILEAQSGMTKKAMQVYEAVDKNINLFRGAVENTEHEIERLTSGQEKLGERVEKLIDFEKQYRNSIVQKGKEGPEDLRPKYFDE